MTDQLTRDELLSLDADGIVAAYRAGQLDELLGRRRDTDDDEPDTMLSALQRKLPARERTGAERLPLNGPALAAHVKTVLNGGE
jgi:hypothetical protein